MMVPASSARLAQFVEPGAPLIEEGDQLGATAAQEVLCDRGLVGAVAVLRHAIGDERELLVE
jgi:hypothetical protein